MTTDIIYEPRYSTSWALVVGINRYQHVSPLGYACNDADKVAETLRTRFAFLEENVVLLKDEAATRDRIISEFLGLATNKVSRNDRVVVFFAGHGLTRTGRRGEVGFLVPVGGRTEELASLVRWDDLTRNAELIPAKHMLFIMDACYGGLAVQRYLTPGSMRFAKDMLQRYSRQVLTAGKADETVADAGGPRPGHSVFTGHLLDAFEGAAATSDKLLTANGVMAYVYDRVAKDYHSKQTPHYGFIDGDGDMVLDLTPLEQLSDNAVMDKDILIEIPASSGSQQILTNSDSLQETLKEYLSDPRYRIKLHDIVTREVRKVLALTDENSFPVQGSNVTLDEFASRLKRYEREVSDLIMVVIMLARWGGVEHKNTLEQVFSRLPDAHMASGGNVVWLALRWYPIILLMYAGGMACIAANDYAGLAAVFLANVGKGYSGERTQPVIVPTVEAILEMNRRDVFKLLPGYERNYAPRSDYLFKVVQPMVEDLLFLGRDYERLFDRFEVFLALVVADRIYDERGNVWGPPGRFGWKYSSRASGQNPFEDLVAEANQSKDNWRPLRAGFFNGSYERFSTIAEGYRELLGKLKWF